MSQQYPGGLITKNPVVPSGPYQNSTASGVWTLDQAAQYVKAGNWPTAGNLPNYIEDVFSTYLIKTPGSVTPVGAVNNGIDLSTQGGMVWLKDRSFAYNHTLVDTVRGPTKRLISNSSAAEADTSTYGFTAFNTNGFTLGNGGGVLFDNGSSGTNVATWTFREQAKFFDVVTYTGNSTAGRTVAHSLGSVPGCIFVKAVSGGASVNSWVVYHRSLGATQRLLLNTTAAAATDSQAWNNTSPTATNFTLGISDGVNDSTTTYVAYIFAHDAGGFGLSGTDNVISCGSFTTDGSGNATVSLGYEPQWLLVKPVQSNGYWLELDVMRGWNVSGTNSYLAPNASDAETSGVYGYPTATGFVISNTTPMYYSNQQYIYIAIRRGPMKVPTSGTSVFSPVAQIGEAEFNNSFPVDAVIERDRASAAFGYTADRLRGGDLALSTTATSAEFSAGPAYFASNNGKFRATFVGGASPSVIYWNFRRAPGFFDVVCYTGTGVARTINHNLAAVPELMIVKKRSGGLARGWFVYSSPLTAAYYTVVNTTAATVNGGTFPWNNTVPTSSVFSVSNDDEVNGASNTYVAYLFATVAGVSKVGSYTGTGTTQVINCGFTAGSRFVMIKRTNSTGDWYVWDSARGIVAGNDPYLLLNSTAAEVTSTDYVDTAATGFEISSTAPAAINANGGTFIFLAIA